MAKFSKAVLESEVSLYRGAEDDDRGNKVASKTIFGGGFVYCIAGERQGPVEEVNCAVAKLVVFRAEVTKELNRGGDREPFLCNFVDVIANG